MKWLVSVAGAVSAMMIANAALADQPAPSPSAPTPSPAATSQAPPKAPAPTASPAVPQVSASGVVVILVGAAEEAAVRETKALARQAYLNPALRPAGLDEAAVVALSGGSTVSDKARLAELRAALGPDLSQQATIAALDNLAAELPAEAMLLFIPSTSGPIVRVVHIDRSVAGPHARIDPAALLANARPDGSYEWGPVVSSAERLIAPRLRAELPTPAPKPKAKPTPGPRKDQLKNGAPVEPAKPSDEDSSSFFESPWFWVAVGGVAATGLTILIVSQVTDVGQGTVALKGKVLP